jgi:hypothetical protein
MLTYGFGVTSNGQSRSVAVSAVIPINGICIGRISFKRPVAHTDTLQDVLYVAGCPRTTLPTSPVTLQARILFVREGRPGHCEEGSRRIREIWDLVLPGCAPPRTGERWERRLYKEIDRCHVFVLFWSLAASQSDWVVKEAERSWRSSSATGGRRPLINQAMNARMPVFAGCPCEFSYSALCRVVVGVGS